MRAFIAITSLVATANAGRAVVHGGLAVPGYGYGAAPVYGRHAVAAALLVPYAAPIAKAAIGAPVYGGYGAPVYGGYGAPGFTHAAPVGKPLIAAHAAPTSLARSITYESRSYAHAPVSGPLYPGHYGAPIVYGAHAGYAAPVARAAAPVYPHAAPLTKAVFAGPALGHHGAYPGYPVASTAKFAAAPTPSYAPHYGGYY